MSNGEEFGVLVYMDPEREKLWEPVAMDAIPDKYTFVHPVRIGEAFNLSLSTKEPTRIENIGGDFALMYVEKDENGREVDSTHMRTYAGRSKSLSVIDHRFAPTTEQAEWVDMLEQRASRLIGKITPSKMTANTIAVIKRCCRGVSLRRHGSVYFIPQAKSSVLEDYLTHIEDFGIFVQMVDVKKTGRSVESIGTGAAEDLMSRVSDVIEKLGEMKTVRGMEARMGEAKELLDLAHMYETVLGIGLDTLKAKIDITQKVIAEAIANM